MHEDEPSYGTSGKHKRVVESVQALMRNFGTLDVLDYGCGKRTLQAALGCQIANYDPALPDYAEDPEPHDIVACTDVLEHIEPSYLHNVLADIRRVTCKAGFLTIAMRPAKRFLADGRNAHLIQKDAQWWTQQLWGAGFRIRQLIDADLELLVVVE